MAGPYVALVVVELAQGATPYDAAERVYEAMARPFEVPRVAVARASCIEWFEAGVYQVPADLDSTRPTPPAVDVEP